MLCIMLVPTQVRTGSIKWLLPMLKCHWQWFIVRYIHQDLLCKHLSCQQRIPRRILKMPFTGAPFSEEPQVKQRASSVARFSIGATVTCNSIVPNLPLPVRGTHMSVMDLFLCLQDSILSGKYIFGMDLDSISCDTCLQPAMRIPCPSGVLSRGTLTCHVAHERALMPICTRCLGDRRLEKVRTARRESPVREGGGRPHQRKCLVPSIQHWQSFTPAIRSDQGLLAS